MRFYCRQIQNTKYKMIIGSEKIWKKKSIGKIDVKSVKKMIQTTANCDVCLVVCLANLVLFDNIFIWVSNCLISSLGEFAEGLIPAKKQPISISHKIEVIPKHIFYIKYTISLPMGMVMIRFHCSSSGSKHIMVVGLLRNELCIEGMKCCELNFWIS